MNCELSFVNYEFMFGQLGGGSFRGHSRLIPGSFRGHSGIIPGSFQDHSGVILGSFQDHSGVIPGSFQDHSRIILRSCWFHFGIILACLFQVSILNRIFMDLVGFLMDFERFVDDFRMYFWIYF